jgi:hypothetical protein
MSRQAYQIPLYACFPAPAILILTLPFIHESPRWLLNHGRPEEALRSLRFLRKGAYDEVALQQEFEEMKVVAEREAETQKDWRLILELFRGTNLRRTIICVGVGTANAGVGAMFILAFGTYFFKTVRRLSCRLLSKKPRLTRVSTGPSRRPFPVDHHQQLCRLGWSHAHLGVCCTRWAPPAHPHWLSSLQFLHARHGRPVQRDWSVDAQRRHWSHCDN